MDNTDLKAKFKQGKLPSEQDYSALIDSIPPSLSSYESYALDDDYDIQGGIVDKGTLTTFKSKIPKTTFNLLFQTDIHYELYSNWKPKMNTGLRHVLNSMYLQDSVNAIVFNGDNINNGGGYEDKKKALKLIEDFTTTVWSLSNRVTPVFINKGNHDNNYRDHTVWNKDNWKTPIGESISNAEFVKYYRYTSSFNENRLSSSSYFYKDFDDYNIRLIGLDSYDLPETSADDKYYDFDGRANSIFSIEQVKWLSQVLNTDKHVVITTHNPINHTLGDWDNATMLNHDLVKGLLEAFIQGGSGSIKGSSGEVEYSFSHKGVIAGVFTGHQHNDSMKLLNGINYIQTTCSAVYADFSDGHADRADFYDTYKEDVFDLIEIDTNKREVDIKRWGYGEDREYMY